MKHDLPAPASSPAPYFKEDAPDAVLAEEPTQRMFVGCIFANALLLAVCWFFWWFADDNLHLFGIFHVAMSAGFSSCLALGSLFAFACTSPSLDQRAMGGSLIVGTAIAWAISQYVRMGSELHWFFLTFWVPTPVVATSVLILFGLRLHVVRNEERRSPWRWQFTIRTIFGGMAITAVYALIISNVGTGLWIAPILMIVAFCHVIVGILSLLLWRAKLVGPIAALGLALLLLFVLNLLPDGLLAISAEIGSALMSVAGIALPWTLIGVHTTWEQPVFER